MTASLQREKGRERSGLRGEGRIWRVEGAGMVDWWYCSDELRLTWTCKEEMMIKFHKTIWRQAYKLVRLVINSNTIVLYKSLFLNIKRARKSKYARKHIDLKSSGHYEYSFNKIINLAVVQFRAWGRHSAEYAAYCLLLLFNGLRESSRKIHLWSYVN
jgi:hypothetical protein